MATNDKSRVSRGLAAASLMVGLAVLAQPALADNKIRILCPTWSGYAPIFVAQDLGYFKKLGVDVSIKFEDERPNVMAAMARKDIEMDIRTVGEYQGRPRDENTPGVLIGTIDQSLGGDGVIAGGEIGSVADLKGKVVASEPNIPGRLLLQLALKKAGMTLKDMTIKEIATADTVAVFTDKSIAAVATYQPFMSQALKNDTTRKPKILLSSSEYPGIVVDVFIARQDDLKANPIKYQKFLIGVYKAIEYFKTNPDDFIKLSGPHFQLSAADFKASIDGSLVYTDLATTQGYFGAPGKPGTLYGVFNTVMQLNLENGAASTNLDADRAIDPSLLAGITAADLKK